MKTGTAARGSKVGVDRLAGSISLMDEAHQPAAVPTNPQSTSAYWNDLLVNGLISGSAQAAQYGLMAAPTVQDERNTEHLARLQRLEKEGKLGLTGAERGQMEHTMLAPVRALATEGRQRAEAALASAGNSTSAVDLNRIQRQADDQAQQMAYQAGATISQRHLDRAAQQLQELEERTAYKAERQKGKREAVAQGIGQLGSVAGQAMATRAVPQMDLSGLSGEAQAKALDIYSEAMTDANPLTRRARLSSLQTLTDAFSTTSGGQ